MQTNKHTHIYVRYSLLQAHTHTNLQITNKLTHLLTHTHTPTQKHTYTKSYNPVSHTHRTAAAEMENVKLPAAVMKSAKKVFPRGRGLTQQHVAQPHLYVLEACLKSLITKGFKCERQVCGNFWYSMLLTLFCLQGSV